MSMQLRLLCSIAGDEFELHRGEIITASDEHDKLYPFKDRPKQRDWRVVDTATGKRMLAAAPPICEPVSEKREAVLQNQINRGR